MAYNRPANPDSLPSFTDPTQIDPSRPKPPSKYETKPPPPIPQSQEPPRRRDDYRREEPRRDDYRREEPRRDDYRREEPRRDDYRREEPRRDDYRREEPRRNDGGHRNSDPRGDARRGHASPNYGPQPMSPTGVPQNRLSPSYRAGGGPSRPPPTPGPDSTSNLEQLRKELRPLFKTVDSDHTGQLTFEKLKRALVNGDGGQFDDHTIKMMIRMFDSNRNGAIGFEEFVGLWDFLAEWRALFDKFDVDKSGTISLDEFAFAIDRFGYRLSPSFVELLFTTYDKRNEGVLIFDLFMQACISLKRMTDVFKKYDDDRDGFITLSFEDFLVEILRQLK